MLECCRSATVAVKSAKQNKNVPFFRFETRTHVLLGVKQAFYQLVQYSYQPESASLLLESVGPPPSQLHNCWQSAYGTAPFRPLWLRVSRSQHTSPRHPQGQVCGAGGAQEPCKNWASTKMHVRVSATYNCWQSAYGAAPFRPLWLRVSRSQHISPRHPQGQVCGAGG